jgi:hypothetical protein
LAFLNVVGCAKSTNVLAVNAFAHVQHVLTPAIAAQDRRSAAQNVPAAMWL